MWNPFDMSFIYPILVGTTSLFLVANDLFAGISLVFSLLIMLSAVFGKVMAYQSNKAPLGLATISIGFLLLSTSGQTIIYLCGTWPDKMGLLNLSPYITVGELILSLILLLVAGLLRD